MSITEETREKLKKARKGKKPSLGMKHSEETKRKMSLKRKGVSKPKDFGEKISKALKGRIKNENIGYGGLHDWLKNNYGVADKCENIACLKKSIKYHWCLIAGKKYERKRENFMMLCCQCHRKYDTAHRGFKVIRDTKGRFVKWIIKPLRSPQAKVKIATHKEYSEPLCVQ